MSKHAIVITFFTIIYGLMLADLFISFHKLISIKKKVKWHWLPILTAWYLFVVILKNWWDLTSLESDFQWMNIGFFIIYGHLFLLLFLLVSTVLPDVNGEKLYDLKKYYFENHRYFWGLMAGAVLVTMLIKLIKNFDQLSEINLLAPVAIAIHLVLLLVLIITKRFRAHAIIVIIFILTTFLEIITK